MRDTEIGCTVDYSPTRTSAKSILITKGSVLLLHLTDQINQIRYLTITIYIQFKTKTMK